MRIPKLNDEGTAIVNVPHGMCQASGVGGGSGRGFGDRVTPRQQAASDRIASRQAAQRRRAIRAGRA